MTGHGGSCYLCQSPLNLVADCRLLKSGLQKALKKVMLSTNQENSVGAVIGHEKPEHIPRNAVTHEPLN